MIRTENPMTHCEIDDTFLSQKELLAVFEHYGSPLFVYDEQRLRNRAKSLLLLFSSCQDHYFPLRHCDIPAILSTVKEEGLGVQCQTEEELQTALSVGFSGQKILYCAMTATDHLARRLKDLDACLMAGSPLALEHALPSRVYLMCRLPKRRNCLGAAAMERCGVGFLPEELPPVIKYLRERGVSFVGLTIRHEGNISEEQFLAQRVRVLQILAERLSEKGCAVDGIHIDGALGVQYNRAILRPMNEEAAASGVNDAVSAGSQRLALSLGNFLLEPCAVFLSTVVDVWQRECPVIVTDGLLSMLRFRNVDRYHHISVPDRPWVENRTVCDVYGNLPVAGEWFAKNRVLQRPQRGEHLVIHDVGCTANTRSGIPILLRQTDGTLRVLQNNEE